MHDLVFVFSVLLLSLLCCETAAILIEFFTNHLTAVCCKQVGVGIHIFYLLSGFVSFCAFDSYGILNYTIRFGFHIKHLQIVSSAWFV